MSIQRPSAALATSGSYTLQIIPGQGMRDVPALETVMSGLVLDTRQPVALELAARDTQAGTERFFVVRTATQASLDHACDQLYARYPQAVLRTLAADPLAPLAPHEAVTCMTLRPGAPSYLPFRAWKPRDWQEEGADPLLGVLAALDHLPEQHRAVAHLVLMPASSPWSAGSLRMAQEHPLEQERAARQSQQRQSSRGSPIDVLLLGLLVLVLVLVQRFWVPLHRILPAWVFQATDALLHGKPLHLTSQQTWQVGLVGFAVLVGCLLVFILFDQIRQRLFGSRTRIYDQQLVRRKTERIAYRAVLRISVIGPALTSEGQQAEVAPLPTWRHLRWHDLISWGCEQARRWRLVTRARAQQRAARRNVATRVIAAYRAYHLASGNSFVPHQVPGWLARLRLAETAAWWKAFFPWYQGLQRSPLLLTAEEVASLFHLLQGADLGQTALLERSPIRTLPVSQVLTTGPGWQLGTNRHAGHVAPVILPAESMGYNTLAVAGTGKGKSTLFQHLARVVLCAPGTGPRRGLVVIDPHGDLAPLLLGCIPPDRVDDTIYVDLSNRAAPPGINLLDMAGGQDRDKVVDTQITISKKYWEGAWGPRTESTLRYALLTLCEANQKLLAHEGVQQATAKQFTILAVVPLLQRVWFREAVLRLVADQDIHDWWQTYYNRLEEEEQLRVAGSIVSKFSKFGATRVVRRIVGQPASTIRVPEILRTGKTLIINTASGIIGEDTSALIGASLLGLLHTSLAEQAQYAVGERAAICVLIDEMQKFVGVDFNGMLSELRKYGGTFALATQSFGYLDELDPTLRHSLLANTDHLFAFDMSAHDALPMCRELGDGIEVDDVVNLNNYLCYAKLSWAGRRLPTFSLALDLPPAPNQQTVSVICTNSSQRYGCPVERVDAIIAHQAKAYDFPSNKNKKSEKHSAATAQDQLWDQEHDQEQAPGPPPGQNRVHDAAKTPRVSRKRATESVPMSEREREEAGEP